MVLTLRLCVMYGPQFQTATFTAYNVKRLVLYNRDGECLLRGTRCPCEKANTFRLQRLIFFPFLTETKGQNNSAIFAHEK